MILAPSRPQLLSGNKLFCILLFFSLSLGSCGFLSSGPIDQPEKIGNQTKPHLEDEDLSKVDTVDWKDERESKIVIDEDDEIDATINKKSSYTVSVLFPFEAFRAKYWEETVDEKAINMIHFYAGLKLAQENLVNRGYNIDLNVYDSKANNNKIDNIIERNELAGTDIIIGPRSKQSMVKMAKYAQNNEITLISPWYKSETAFLGNQYYIQSGASLSAHCEAITQHISEVEGFSNVLLVSREKEKDRFDYFQNAYRKITGEINNLPELLIEGDGNDLEELTLVDYLNPEGTTVVVIPYYNNQSFIYSVLRKLQSEKGNGKIVVYGFSQWKDYEYLYPLFDELNVRLSANGTADETNILLKEFNKTFYSIYKDLPNDEAYKGYDLMQFIGQMLDKYGTTFQFSSGKRYNNYLYTNFDIQPVFTKTTSTDQRRTEALFFENKYVQILTYEEHKFVPFYNY